MSNINVMRKNLGPVTAYKYAVQQGYTGTEQEFAALMASYATVAEEAESAKDDAIDAKTAAEEAQAAAEAAAEQAEGAIEVDDTLSVRGRAADAAETGKLRKKLSFINDLLYSGDGYGFPLEFENGTYRNTSVGKPLEKYHEGEYDQIRKVISTTVFTLPCDAKVTAKEGYSFTVFLASDGVITQNSGLVTEYELKKDTQYGMTLLTTGGSDDISDTAVDDIITISYENTISKIENDLVVTNSTVDKLYNSMYEADVVDIPLNKYSYFITESNLWRYSQNVKCVIIRIDDLYDRIIITANDEQNAAIAFLQTDVHTSETAPNYAQGCTRTVVSAGETRTLNVPIDATYMYILITYQLTDRTPDLILGTHLKDSVIIPLGLHERPISVNALNIVKRCRQMTDIKWVPAVDLPRFMLVQTSDAPETAESQNYKTTFKAGVEYKGIPYGRTHLTMDDYGYTYVTVGNYIGFDTFISSVSNPKSKMCVEDISNVTGPYSVIYATVCSGLTCYALDVEERSTGDIDEIPGLSLIGIINNDGVLLDDSTFKIGDVLNKNNYHTAIITDIIRDGNGIIQMIELSDASTGGLADRNYANGKIGGICRRKGWTREQLFGTGSGKWGSYSLYRYSGDVTYTPNQYVNVGDEFDGWAIAHFPIMPYEGEGFVYNAENIPDDSIHLVITLDGYNYVKVFKDGVEIDGSPFSVTSELDDIIVDTIEAGDYTAYLCNLENGQVINCTYPCHWEIKEV